MRRIFFLLVILQLTLFACINNQSETTYSLKDSVIQKYFAAIDSSDHLDTSDYNYSVLRAYISNDTIFLKKMNADIDNFYKFKLHAIDDSCVHQKKLQDLNADEAYRFNYTGAFCPYKLIITVSSNLNLHFLLYQIDGDTTPCRIISEYDKILTSKNWEDIKESIDRADFWGLKSTNEIHGLDGSTWITTGFTKRNSKFHYVYRWGSTTLSEPFNLVLRLSGNKQGCLWIE